MNQYPNGILNEGIANLRHKCKNFKLNNGVLSEDLCFKLKMKEDAFSSHVKLELKVGEEWVS